MKNSNSSISNYENNASPLAMVASTSFKALEDGSFVKIIEASKSEMEVTKN
jgi:hypothetical protein